MSTTRVTQHVKAPRAAVYRALIDEKSVQVWMVPDGMTSTVHYFEGREGGGFRISLTYDSPDAIGKSADHTDTYHGTFAKLVENEVVIQKVEFETGSSEMQGEMTMTFTLVDADGGTEVRGLHEDVPPGVKPEDNELGWKMTLGKLAELVESRNPR
jgi:uncharacterized protein YndB with AHSA1/START domain